MLAQIKVLNLCFNSVMKILDRYVLISSSILPLLKKIFMTFTVSWSIRDVVQPNLKACLFLPFGLLVDCFNKSGWIYNMYSRSHTYNEKPARWGPHIYHGWCWFWRFQHPSDSCASYYFGTSSLLHWEDADSF